jgi:hypothetical protein
MTTVVRLSIGECESLALKALRGVGCDWGIAQEGAFAVGMLCERGVPALRSLAVLTQAYDAHGRVAPPACCPLTLGVRIMDSVDAVAALDASAKTTVVAPVLMLPFVARALDDAAEAVVLNWQSGAVHISPGLDIGFAAARALGGVSVDVLENCLRAPVAEQGKYVSVQERRAEVWRRCLSMLEAFAHRTYVPASEASRASGAGGEGPDD